MTGLLWPNRSGQYLLLASTNYSGNISKCFQYCSDLRIEDVHTTEQQHDFGLN